MKKILMITAQYPPIKGSSGLQRSLKFSQYLPEFGWQPIVLTMNNRAYQETSNEQLHEIPQSIIVKRAFALDAQRHLSILGRYPRWLALPDRWSTWLIGAVLAGKRLIRSERPDVIWSTFPIATAHRIGLALSRWAAIPWIADFRDSMTEEDYPVDLAVRRSRLEIEKTTVSNASACVFTAPSAREIYARRYPDVPAENWTVISNGYDEENFLGLSNPRHFVGSDRLLLLHSGLLDPVDRDPTCFFQTIAELKTHGKISQADLEIRLRASGFDEQYANQIRELDIQDIVQLLEPVPYMTALAEMQAANGLLLFQGKNCNHQIPAKAYEYMRAGRPILCLADANGDTGRVLQSVGVRHVAALESFEDVRATFGAFMTYLKGKRAEGVSARDAAKYARRSLTQDLATLCDRQI